MKKSKNLFIQLVVKVGRSPVQAGQRCCRVDETKIWRTNRVWSTNFVENASRPNLLRPRRNQRQKKSACPVRCVFYYLTGVKIPPWGGKAK
ncbi:MAG: hypothetical protein JW947_04655 [Sedimentisphaerales bacterium]|nr:hypothetical protein [Sedimentisphaerales bacterium]